MRSKAKQKIVTSRCCGKMAHKYNNEAENRLANIVRRLKSSAMHSHSGAAPVREAGCRSRVISRNRAVVALLHPRRHTLVATDRRAAPEWVGRAGSRILIMLGLRFKTIKTVDRPYHLFKQVDFNVVLARQSAFRTLGRGREVIQPMPCI